MCKFSLRIHLYSFLIIFFLLVTLFPRVVLANLPSSQDASSSAESDVVFVYENCENFKEGECISFAEFKEQERKSLVDILDLLRKYVLQVETDVAEHQKNINLINTLTRKHNTVELEEIKYHLLKKFILEQKLLIITEEQLSLLKELVMSCEEALNFLQKEVVEVKHLPLWQEIKDMLSQDLEMSWQKIKKSTEAREKVSSMD